jgi:hypothetical protein
MATKSGQRGRYICKVGFYDIYAKDTYRKKQARNRHQQVESTVYNIHHAKKLIEANLNSKEKAVERCKELLGDTFRAVYNI